MRFEDFLDEISNSCEKRGGHRDDCCECECDKRGHRDCDKEFLGKSVSECKYFRICKSRFFEAEKDCDRGCDHKCDKCDRNENCRSRCCCCKCR